jgi:O-antigen/teichoic acid export membrane protein
MSPSSARSETASAYCSSPTDSTEAALGADVCLNPAWQRVDPLPMRAPAEFGRRAFRRARREAATITGSSLTRNAGKLGGAGVVILAMGLVQSVLVARWLGPKNFGVAALVLGVPALIFTFFDPQTREAVVKYLGEFTTTGEPQKALAVPKLAYVIDGLLGVVGVAVVALLAPWAATYILHDSALIPLLIVAGAAQIASAPAETSRAVLATFGRFDAIAWQQSTTMIARLVLVLVAVGLGGGVSGFVYAACAAAVLDSLLAGWLAHRVIRASLGHAWWHGKRRDVAPRLSEMRHFLVYTELTTLVSVFVKQADVVILGWIRGPVEAGYYRLARSITTPATTGTLSLQSVLYPRVSQLTASDEPVDLLARARRWFLRAGLPLGLASLAFVPIVPQIIDKLAGPDYLGAVGATRWLLVGSAFVLACFWLRPIQLATHQVRFMFVTSVIIGVVALAGFVLLSDPFGAAGVAAVRTVVAGFFGTGVGLWWLRRQARSGALSRKPGADLETGRPAPLVEHAPESDVLVGSATVVP